LLNARHIATESSKREASPAAAVSSCCGRNAAVVGRWEGWKRKESGSKELDGKAAVDFHIT